ncbi:MAG: hypothetical protein ABF290_12980, partial [Thiogranum sp.]
MPLSCRAELSFFDPAEPEAGVAVRHMRNYGALAHWPARKRGVVQKYNIDHFIAFQLNIGPDMSTLVADIQRGRLTDTDSRAKKFNAQFARNTPIVSVFHR